MNANTPQRCIINAEKKIMGIISTLIENICACPHLHL